MVLDWIAYMAQILYVFAILLATPISAWTGTFRLPRIELPADVNSEVDDHFWSYSMAWVLLSIPIMTWNAMRFHPAIIFSLELLVLAALGLSKPQIFLTISLALPMSSPLVQHAIERTLSSTWMELVWVFCRTMDLALESFVIFIFPVFAILVHLMVWCLVRGLPVVTVVAPRILMFVIFLSVGLIEFQITSVRMISVWLLQCVRRREGGREGARENEGLDRRRVQHAT